MTFRRGHCSVPAFDTSHTRVTRGPMMVRLEFNYDDYHGVPQSIEIIRTNVVVVDTTLFLVWKTKQKFLFLSRGDDNEKDKTTIISYGHESLRRIVIYGVIISGMPRCTASTRTRKETLFDHKQNLVFLHYFTSATGIFLEDNFHLLHCILKHIMIFQKISV